MLTKRIIPCLDVDHGRVVKGKQFINLCDAGDPVELAKSYELEGADELVLLDITASSEGREIFIGIIQQVAREIFIPFTVGGGIRSIQNIQDLLLAGADKVAINTAALQNPKLIAEAALKFGSQCIVVAIDVKSFSNRWWVYSHGGRMPTEKDAIEWSLEVESLGAGEILLTSIDRDGTKAGYDIDLIQILSRRLKIPVIASGGVGNWQHILEGLREGGADAALMASILHLEDHSIQKIKYFLKQNNLNVRM